MSRVTDPATQRNDPNRIARRSSASEQADQPVDDWPSDWRTWRRYWFIGRWNYAKGIALAGAISFGCAALGSVTAAVIVITLALAYVLFSGFGLFLLYGPPSQRIFRKLFSDANVKGPVRLVDIHFGTWRCSRIALEQLPEATVHAIGVEDPEHELEQAVVDVWKFERPPTSHSRFTMSSSRPDALPIPNCSADVVLLGFGIHEIHAGPDREALMTELRRVLVPGGKVLLMERGWSPLLALVFGPLFFHFTPAREWKFWLRANFREVKRSSKYAMVDLFVASDNAIRLPAESRVH